MIHDALEERLETTDNVSVDANNHRERLRELKKIRARWLEAVNAYKT